MIHLPDGLDVVSVVFKVSVDSSVEVPAFQNILNLMLSGDHSLFSLSVQFCDITWKCSAKSFHFLEIERMSAIIHLDNDISASCLLAWNIIINYFTAAFDLR